MVAAIVYPADAQRYLLEGSLNRCGVETHAVSTARELEQLLASRDICLICCDEVVPDGDFRSILGIVNRFASRAPLVVVSHFCDWPKYLEMIRLGVFDLVALPCPATELDRVLRNALLECVSARALAQWAAA
jgi:DNA-binding NtrC family response regulator